MICPTFQTGFCQFHVFFGGEPPNVVILQQSTGGTATHPQVEPVQSSRSAGHLTCSIFWGALDALPESVGLLKPFKTRFPAGFLLEPVHWEILLSIFGMISSPCQLTLKTGDSAFFCHKFFCVNYGPVDTTSTFQLTMVDWNYNIYLLFLQIYIYVRERER